MNSVQRRLRNRGRAFCAFCAFCGFILTFNSAFAQDSDELKLISILQSNVSLQDKDAACVKLRLIATAKSVPALAALLTDEQLSHSARLVLEAMSDPAAGRALVEALGRTSGATRIGIVNSIGVRAEPSAVAPLAKLLTDPDVATVSAAADALGQIGGSDAIKALETAPHAMAINGLLACANRLLDAGDKSGALEIFKRFDDAKEKDFVRTAAFRGIVRASGGKSLPLVVAAIQGGDRAKQIAALQLVRDLDDPATTKAIAELLPKVSPAIQTSLIDALTQRGDASAASAILPLVTNRNPTVRLAAIYALGVVGDASVAAALARVAAAGDPASRRAVRQALVQLKHGDVVAALLAYLPEASPEEASEIALAIGQRAEGQPVSALVKILELSGRDETVNAARDAIAHACQRAQGEHRALDLDPLIAAMKSEKAAVRAAVLQILSGLADPKVRDALREAKASRAICESRDPELLPDIVALAKGGDETVRVLAIRGGVRLATEAVSLSHSQRIETLKTLLAAATRDEERRLVIGGFANSPCDETLAIAKSMLNSPGVAAEAKLAAEQIEAAMSARKLSDGYILDWQVAGPLRENGKDYRALFDTVFPPENPDAKDVAWRALSSGTNAQKPWLLDLLKALGDEHQRVAYVRTRIRSDSAQAVRLEIGSDDGVKVWVNGALVHANNIARAIAPGSDKVNVSLNAGWNTVLMKITQNIMGWEFCVRLVQPDGAPVANVGISAER